MLTTPELFAKVLATVGEKARPVRTLFTDDGALTFLVTANRWEWAKGHPCDPADAANAIAVHWLGMLLEVGEVAIVRSEPSAVNDGKIINVNVYSRVEKSVHTAATVLEALARAVEALSYRHTGECHA